MRGFRSWLGPLSCYSTVPLSRSASSFSCKLSTSAALSLCMSSSVAAKKIGDDILLSKAEAAAAAAMVSVAFDAHRQFCRHCCNLPSLCQESFSI